MFNSVVVFLAFGLTLFTAVPAFAQAEKGARKDKDVSPQPTSCEVSRIVLDRAFIEFQKRKDSSYLIIISRRGSGEKLSSLTARTRDLEKFIKFRRVTDRYVLAEGPTAGGLGSTEIYVGGVLSEVFYSAPNSKLFCVP